MTPPSPLLQRGSLWMAIAMLITAALYWPGLRGGYVFDDYPNIVDNTALQIESVSVPALVRAALSSPSSAFKRPLASVSFALNHAFTGLDPFWMKLTNLALHLLNGGLLFLLGCALLRAARPLADDAAGRRMAALLAAAWLLLPINLTAVLYVVQRMESLAQIFIVLGLLGYLRGRREMQTEPWRGAVMAAASLVVMTGLGLLAKETAVLLPLLAFILEWLVLGGLSRGSATRTPLLLIFVGVLGVPLVVGSLWVIPMVLDPQIWVHRDFTLGQRLLTEARVLVAYIAWTFIPLPGWLSFYHDHFPVSTGLTQPWTTLPALVVIAAWAALIFVVRRRRPLLALGLAWYLAAHSLTGTILPLELVFEHRNYFASYALLLAALPLLWPLPDTSADAQSVPERRPTQLLVGALLVFWSLFTALSALAWSHPLRLAVELAGRAPHSPRAQYELGRTALVLSAYDPHSPLIETAQQAFETAARLPGASILPEQALIYMNARMNRPIAENWWQHMFEKIRAHPPSAEEDGAIMALTRCARDGDCALPVDKMIELYATALSHPNPRAGLLIAYGDYAWNVLHDPALAERLVRDAVAAAPREHTYRITLIKMLIATGQTEAARAELATLERQNRLGDLDAVLAPLYDALHPAARSSTQREAVRAIKKPS